MEILLLSRYKHRLHSALTERSKLTLPTAWKLLISAVVFVSTYIVLALFIRPKGTTADHHFINEDGAITALSAVMMAIAAGLTVSAYIIAKQNGFKDRHLWLLLATAFGFLALDELLEFHENIGGVLNILTSRIGMDSGAFRNWNDIIVIAYGLIALPIGLYFLPVVLRYPGLMECMTLGGLFFVIHTVIDSVSEPSVKSVVMEESAKLFTAMFLALSAFTALRGTMHKADVESRESR
jgi:hypothetical protein